MSIFNTSVIFTKLTTRKRKVEFRWNWTWEVHSKEHLYVGSSWTRDTWRSTSTGNEPTVGCDLIFLGPVLRVVGTVGWQFRYPVRRPVPLKSNFSWVVSRTPVPFSSSGIVGIVRRPADTGSGLSKMGHLKNSKVKPTDLSTRFKYRRSESRSWSITPSSVKVIY